MEKTRSFLKERTVTAADGVRYKKKQISTIIQKKHIHVIGDGQFDSRGFSASIHRYSIAEHKTKLILDNEVVDRTETKG